MAKVKLVQTLHLSLVAAPARLSLSAASIQHKQGITETNDQTSLGQVPSHFSSDGHEVRYDSTTCSSVTNIPSPSPSLALTGLPVLSYSQQYSFSFHLIVGVQKLWDCPWYLSTSIASDPRHIYYQYHYHHHHCWARVPRRDLPMTLPNQ
jgi:hypothetical protein